MRMDKVNDCIRIFHSKDIVGAYFSTIKCYILPKKSIYYIDPKFIGLVYKLFDPLGKSAVIEKQILLEMLNSPTKHILLVCTKIE